MRLKALPFFLLFTASWLMAQTSITGTIKDHETGKPLAYTNIQIKDAYQGTITNRDGRFSLPVKHMPVTLVIRFIGYETETVTVTNETAMPLSIRLTPKAVEAPTIVVTTDDPAVGIMAQVIRKKAVWREKLKSYQAEAYTRAVLSNDTSIVSISESSSEVFWHHEKGPREVVHSRQESSNITSDDNFAFAGFIPNLYDDDIEFMGFRMIGPTHRDALKHYHFKMTGERRLGDKTVIDIDIRPKNKLQPTFVGRVSVIYEDSAIIDMDVKPNDAMLFPMPIQEMNMHFRQQYANFDSEFWLPMDVRIEGDLSIGMTGLSFPTIKYAQVSHLTDFVINQPLPDSLYKTERYAYVDSLASERDTLLMASEARVPLTEEESNAYASLDSTMTLEKAFKPRGPLARFVNMEADNDGAGGGEANATIGIASGLGPQFAYNRVDGLRGGIGYERRFFKKLTVKGHTAYSLASEKWSGGAGIDLRLHRRLTASFDWSSQSEVWESSWNLPVFINSVNNVMGGRDYFDYLWREGWQAGMVWRLPWRAPWRRTVIAFSAADWRHEALDKETDWGIFNRDRDQRTNPTPETARLRTLSATLTLGGELVPWGTVGNNRLELQVEHSDDQLWASDASYTRYNLFWEGRIPTFLRRRIMPLALDFRITAGTHSGTLPRERLFAMDGRIGSFTPFGTFRTLDGARLMGDEYVGIFWEHHFRTVPFEVLGLRSLAQRGWGMLIHGASGRTWMKEERQAEYTQAYTGWNEWNHEVGLSLTGIFDLLRVDVTKRLGHKGFYAGFSVARMF